MDRHPQSLWTRTEDKIFENALLNYPDGTPNRWHLIATHIPGKTTSEVSHHYDALVADVEAIMAGWIEVPAYIGEEDEEDGNNGDGGESYDDVGDLEDGGGSNQVSERQGGSMHPKAKSADDRKKGTPWTEEEHKRFLIGLVKHGKGDWRNISRWAVKTKTPAQVASHAQKYFLRQAATNKESKRKSIHDISNPHDGPNF